MDFRQLSARIANCISHPRACWPQLGFRTRLGFAYAVVLLAMVVVMMLGSVVRLPAGVAGVPVEERRLQAQVRAQGDLRARDQATVYPAVPGTVLSVVDTARDDDRVEQGEELVRLDDRDIRLELQEAEAALWGAKAEEASARGRLNVATQSRDRAERLYKQDLIPRDERDQEVANYEDLKSRLESAESRVKQAQVRYDKAVANLEETVVRSPINGVLLRMWATAGEPVSPSSRPLFEIAPDLDHMELHLLVNEADIGKVRLGQAVLFTVEAHPGVEFEGRVRSIRRGGEERSGIRVYEVLAEAGNPGERLLPGMSVQARIQIEDAESRPAIPLEALVFQPDSDRLMRNHRREIEQLRDAGNSIVWIWSRGGAIRPIGVRLGEQDDDYVVLVEPSGLPGSTLILYRK